MSNQSSHGGDQKGKSFLHVVGWRKRQHYHARSSPAWIKQYANRLDDPVFAALPDNAKAHMFGIEMLSARMNNRIPHDWRFIGPRINANPRSRSNIPLLIEQGFIAICASTSLAGCEHCASTDKTRQEEKRQDETETTLDAPVPVVSGPETQRTDPTDDGATDRVLDAWRSARTGREGHTFTAKDRTATAQGVREHGEDMATRAVLGSALRANATVQDKLTSKKTGKWFDKPADIFEADHPEKARTLAEVWTKEQQAGVTRYAEDPSGGYIVLRDGCRVGHVDEMPSTSATVFN